MLIFSFYQIYLCFKAEINKLGLGSVSVAQLVATKDIMCMGWGSNSGFPLLHT